MQALTKAIKDDFENFESNAEKAVNGNKAAGVRARKAAQALIKKLKEFRILSVKIANEQ